ncbi:MAG: RluA family pseudouridine synthase [Lachnospiraceae bacterium]|nr:RluA family pseudouridine synthase [Lachnospiraceae bacterium]
MILYEDKEILVCHKPAGIPVQSASVREKDMVSILRNHLESDIYVVHRLDQPVEGILVFAKTRSAAAGLSRQITEGSMRKLYHAVVEVQPQADFAVCPDFTSWHTLTDYLVKDGRNNKSFVVKKETKDAKRAELKYRILKYKTTSETTHTGLALVEIELLTGRHHQIRVQMAHAGLPLLGDRKYNPNDTPSSPLALCAVSLTFRHPLTKKQMIFEVQPQSDAFTL